MLYSIQTMIDNAIDLADMRNTAFVDLSGNAGTELLRYFNIAYGDIYNKIVLSNNLFFASNYIFSITGSTDTYSLPSDYMLTLGVEVEISQSGAQVYWITLDRFMFRDRNKYSTGVLFPPLTPLGYTLKYEIIQDSIKFIPFPVQSTSARLWYVPIPTQITSFTGTIELVPGCERYIPIYMAMLMRSKSEDLASVDRYMQMLTPISNDIMMITANKETDPAYIVDETLKNAGSLYPFARLW